MTITNHDIRKPSIPLSPLSDKSSGRARSFASFIQSCRVTNSPRGDFISDTKMLIDIEKFPDVQSWGEFYCCMTSRHACPEAIAEGRKLWREYQKSQGAVPRRIKRETAP